VELATRFGGLAAHRIAVVRSGSPEPLLSPSIVREALEPFRQQSIRPRKVPDDRRLPSWGRRVFSYAAGPAALDPTILSVRDDGDVVVEHVRYRTGPLTWGTAFVLRSSVLTGARPGVLAFHCHSGVYRWGKEKLAAAPDDPEALRRFREAAYAGRSVAADLARAGFLVVAPDAFYFGERALGREGIDADGIDALRRRSEEVVAKVLLLCGFSWPALLAWEDRRALEYLWQRPDVDRGGVGCLGLSLGGFRAMLLGARDVRVKAVVTAGWLTTGLDLLAGKVYRHSWMVIPHAILPQPDLPGLAAGARPAAFMGLLCADDHLFTRAGAEEAARRVRSAYSRAGLAERCRIETFATPHRMTVEMQTAAAGWLRRYLGA
jgi:dienelactone hydrolase